MQNQPIQTIKSSTTAGLLGLFLGPLGVHNFYLNQIGKGIAHLILTVLPFVVLFIAATIGSTSDLSISEGQALGWGCVFLVWISLGVNSMWAFIESIIIFAQGDAGLARKGYRVAGSIPPYQPPIL